MKRTALLLISFCCLVVFLLRADFVEAHALGLPAFFKINEEIAKTSLMQSIRFAPVGFISPQDTSYKTFLVNEPIVFEIDTGILQSGYPADIFAKMRYEWDFGNGDKRNGVKNIYQYAKPGSYILTVNADYGKETAYPQLIESVQVDVLAEINYVLPVANILIDGKSVKDPMKDSLSFDLSKELIFDGSKSFSASSEIVEYIWDFGDGTTSKGEVVKHQYKQLYSYVSPSLQIKDKNGFISYAFVDIVTFGGTSPTPSVQAEVNTGEEQTLNKSSLFVLALFIFGLVMLPGVMVSLRRNRLRRK